ncbi:MAG: hypothetical protein M1833_004513 [Piccolia ochrophora]|nr:MAG: hypothetical protein M1833_004513 [Piccolia ochrophora]
MVVFNLNDLDYGPGGLPMVRAYLAGEYSPASYITPSFNATGPYQFGTSDNWPRGLWKYWFPTDTFPYGHPEVLCVCAPDYCCTCEIPIHTDFLDTLRASDDPSLWMLSADEMTLYLNGTVPKVCKRVPGRPSPPREGAAAAAELRSGWKVLVSLFVLVLLFR